MNKTAVLSMDVEDWYHLYYFLGKADKNYTMLDGFKNYIELMNKNDIKTTFFVLGELAKDNKELLNYAVDCGHEIACHGMRHIRPMDLSVDEFAAELKDAKQTLEDVIGREVVGYRAPCYGIDDERYKVVQETGFKYSSSKMNVKGHPLYGELNLDEFEQVSDGIYKKSDMTEFALSTEKFLGKDIAVSGGGWIRLLPWNFLMKPLIKKHTLSNDTYFLYIHPFELSKKPMPKVKNTGILTEIRAHKGLGKVDVKIEELIKILKCNEFSFSTFRELAGV